MSDQSNDGIVEITEAELNDVRGGLPAVQKVREAAARMSSSSATQDDTPTYTFVGAAG